MPEVTYEMYHELKQKVDKLEENEKDGREWRGEVNTKLDNISTAIVELKASVQALASKPAQRWDMIVAALIAAGISAAFKFIK